jgi:anti-anti-sigma regulatory factor
MDIYNFTAHKEFTILKLRGDIKIAELPALSPALGDHISLHPLKHIVLDLSEVTSIDRSIAMLFANIRKRLETNKRKLFTLHASPQIVSLLKSVNVNESIDDIGVLEYGLNEDLFTTFSQYSYEEHDLRRLQCGCVVCGTRNVAGYLINPNRYSWSWPDGGLFPACADTSGEEFDFFAALPIICLDCCMVSTDLRHFNLIDKNNVVMLHSTLSESAKIHLTKNIKKRKKLIEGCAEAGNPDFFLYPRNRKAVYYLYLLADSSIRTLALNKADADPFLVGFLNYIAIRYAEREAKGELIDNCRTWLTQARTEKKILSHGDEALTLFVLFAAALTLDRVKEANGLMQELSAMMEGISYSKTASARITSPLFWHTQVQAMWRKEIEKKSSSFSKQYLK